MLVLDTIQMLHTYPNSRFEDGEVVYIKNENSTYIYNNNEWVKMTVNSNNSGFSISQYELNKMLIKQLPPLTDEQLAEKAKELSEFEKNDSSTYYMLLCRDINYYSIFNPYLGATAQDALTFGEEVIACVQDVGTVISIDVLPNESFEIWVVTDTEEEYCMYLFSADGFMVPYRR